MPCATDSRALSFPVATMVRFCHNHGLLQITNRPQWWTVQGGAQNYVKKIVQGIAAIPHLTKLAHEHKGKLEVIGISIAEQQESAADTAYIEMVAKFVEKRGDQMDYRVAVDTPDKKMHTTWFTPTGTGGIPTAYIIDQNGLVAWTGIGNPAVIEQKVHELLARAQ